MDAQKSVWECLRVASLSRRSHGFGAAVGDTCGEALSKFANLDAQSSMIDAGNRTLERGGSCVPDDGVMWMDESSIQDSECVTGEVKSVVLKGEKYCAVKIGRHNILTPDGERDDVYNDALRTVRHLEDGSDDESFHSVESEFTGEESQTAVMASEVMNGSSNLIDLKLGAVASEATVMYDHQNDLQDFDLMNGCKDEHCTDDRKYDEGSSKRLLSDFEMLVNSEGDVISIHQRCDYGWKKVDSIVQGRQEKRTRDEEDWMTRENLLHEDFVDGMRRLMNIRRDTQHGMLMILLIFLMMIFRNGVAAMDLPTDKTCWPSYELSDEEVDSQSVWDWEHDWDHYSDPTGGFGDQDDQQVDDTPPVENCNYNEYYEGYTWYRGERIWIIRSFIRDIVMIILTWVCYPFVRAARFVKRNKKQIAIITILLLVVFMAGKASAYTVEEPDDDGKTKSDTLKTVNTIVGRINPETSGLPALFTSGLMNLARGAGQTMTILINGMSQLAGRPLPRILTPDFKTEIKDLENDVKQIKDFFEDMRLDLSIIQAGEDEEDEYLDEEYEEMKKVQEKLQEAMTQKMKKDVEKEKVEEAVKEKDGEDAADHPKKRIKKSSEKMMRIMKTAAQSADLLKELQKKINETQIREEEAQTCQTLKCVTVGMVELILDGMFRVFGNPIRFSLESAVWLRETLKNQAEALSQIFGAFLFMFFANGLIYLYSRGAMVYKKVRKFVKFIMEMPLFIVLHSMSQNFCGLCGIQKKEKKKDEKKLEKEVQRLGENVGILIDEMQRGHRENLDVYKEMNQAYKKQQDKNIQVFKGLQEDVKRWQGKDDGASSSTPKGRSELMRCDYCGRFGHTAESCFKKARDIKEISQEPEIKERNKAGCWFCGKEGHVMANCPKRRARERSPPPYMPKGKRLFAITEDEESIDSDQKEKGPPRESVVNAADQESRTLMFTPLWVQGVKIDRCLVDTGSEVNVFPLKDMTKNGFSYSLDGVHLIKSFDGSVSKSLGKFEGSARFGPSKDERGMEFLVSEHVAYPIIGLPTLKEFDLNIDCKKHELVDGQSGSIVRCTATSLDKLKKGKN